MLTKQCQGRSNSPDLLLITVIMTIPSGSFSRERCPQPCFSAAASSVREKEHVGRGRGGREGVAQRSDSESARCKLLGDPRLSCENEGSPYRTPKNSSKNVGSGSAMGRKWSRPGPPASLDYQQNHHHHQQHQHYDDDAAAAYDYDNDDDDDEY